MVWYRVKHAVMATLLLLGMATGLAGAAPSNLSGVTARNVILLIGDGMGLAQRAAARSMHAGADGQLAMDTLPVMGLSKTDSADNLITDSAAAATAMASGVKTYNGAIGVDVSFHSTPTILEIARDMGKATGLVTNVQMAHATPAAFAAHTPSRTLMLEIARQMLANEVDVLLGGGEDEFLPLAATGCHPEPGERLDGRDLIAEAVAAGYVYVCDEAGFNAVDPAGADKLLGLFADEGMLRPYSPSLAAMTEKALDILGRNPSGFFLMVEGGQIDWAAHDNDAENVLGDVIAFDEAVAVVLNFATNNPETLVIVTADHETGGLTIEGDVADDEEVGEDGPYNTPEGRSFVLDWTTDEHTGIDAPTGAQGPGSRLLAGVYENTHIFDVMQAALTCVVSGDLDGNGQVDVLDIQIVSAQWRMQCP